MIKSHGGRPKNLPNWLPGDPKGPQLVAQIIRVDHAGEYGAQRIYQGQMAVLRHDKIYPLLRHMYKQEQQHLQYFSHTIVQHKIRPTIMHPIWHLLGYAMGWVTGRMGAKAAMACTVAVESEIEKHYASQLCTLQRHSSTFQTRELEEKIKLFQAEEVEHHDIGVTNEAQHALGYPIIHAVIGYLSRAAIYISIRW